jgi:hypothetical protein
MARVDEWHECLLDDFQAKFVIQAVRWLEITSL